jgi:3-deoxy-7-phosphoheptulonate synthase
MSPTTSTRACGSLGNCSPIFWSWGSLPGPSFSIPPLASSMPISSAGGAIGARTAESQIHRELASGLSMPVGIKNRTDGNVQVAVDAIQAARSRHLFPSLTKEGAPAILETTGNPYAHLVLRGGSETGPNFDAASIQSAVGLLRAAELPEVLMVDCSHGNSEKDAVRQIDVAGAIMKNLRDSPIRALMIESHLVAGRQNAPVTYGQSITDACLGFDETKNLLYRLADAL